MSTSSTCPKASRHRPRGRRRAARARGPLQVVHGVTRGTGGSSVAVGSCSGVGTPATALAGGGDASVPPERPPSRPKPPARSATTAAIAIAPREWHASLGAGRERLGRQLLDLDPRANGFDRRRTGPASGGAGRRRQPAGGGSSRPPRHCSRRGGPPCGPRPVTMCRDAASGIPPARTVGPQRPARPAQRRVSPTTLRSLAWPAHHHRRAGRSRGVRPARDAPGLGAARRRESRHSSGSGRPGCCATWTS